MTHEETLFKMIADMSGSIGRIEGGLNEVKNNQAEFRVSLLHLFDLHSNCPGPSAAKSVADLRSDLDHHLDRTTTTRNVDSSDKVSRPPKSPVMSDRTIQMLIILCIIALGGAGVLVQIFGV